jgi:hypothetical protein
MHDADIIDGLELKFNSLAGDLDERGRRRWAATEAMAMALGYGIGLWHWAMALGYGIGLWHWAMAGSPRFRSQLGFLIGRFATALRSFRAMTRCPAIASDAQEQVGSLWKTRGRI